jgi:hypothetical protein
VTESLASGWTRTVPKDHSTAGIATAQTCVPRSVYGGRFEPIVERQSLIWLGAKDLQIGRYQRPLNKDWARRIADNFDPYQFGLLMIGQRFDGSLWVIDGQTRLAAAKIVGEWHVPCLVIHGTTEQEEARKFLSQSTARKVSPVDSYHSALAGGSVRAKQIQESLERAGFVVPRSSGNSFGIDCVQRLCGLHRYGDGLLDEVLQLLRDCYGKATRNMSGQLMAGLAEFVVTYRGEYKREIAVKRFSAVDPMDVRIKAMTLNASLGKLTGGGSGRAYAMTYRTIYESPSHTLPDKTYRRWSRGELNAAQYLSDFGGEGEAQ